LMAPVLFNPYPTRDGLYEDIKDMMEWVHQPFRKGEFKSANNSDERPTKMNVFWTKALESSWQGWFMKNIYVDVWETIDRFFNSPLNLLTWYSQQTIFWLWRYFPWVLLAWLYWNTESVYYAVTIVVVCVILFSIEKFMRNMHQYFAILKILPIFLIPPMVLFYENGTLTGLQLLQSMFMYIIVGFMLIEVILGVWNVTVKIFTGTVFRNSGRGVQRRLMGWRLFVPLMVFQPQVIWPYATIAVLTIGNFLTIAFGGALTAFLYNGRVADIWSRAYIQQRES